MEVKMGREKGRKGKKRGGGEKRERVTVFEKIFPFFVFTSMTRKKGGRGG